MTQHLRNTLKQGWAGKNLTSAQFEEYLSLYETLPAEFAARDALIQRINNHEVGESTGPDGEFAVELIDDYFTAAPRAFLTGILLWNDVARQQNELEKLKTMPSPQEMLKQVHIPLLLNPEAITWISRALEIHL